MKFLCTNCGINKFKISTGPGATPQNYTLFITCTNCDELFSINQVKDNIKETLAKPKEERPGYGRGYRRNDE